MPEWYPPINPKVPPFLHSGDYNPDHTYAWDPYGSTVLTGARE